MCDLVRLGGVGACLPRLLVGRRICTARVSAMAMDDTGPTLDFFTDICEPMPCPPPSCTRDVSLGRWACLPGSIANSRASVHKRRQGTRAGTPCGSPATHHMKYNFFQVPNIDCYIPGMAFLCIVITSESAKLVETGQEIGPVRARTCVPAKDFSKKSVSYSMCSKLSKELSASEIFSRIAVSRPQCTLCKKHLCTDAVHC
ncbi:hypothetical protein RR48_14054 [Papilio machaon]|uniref:Uncharacterized protein n=1 Tax=Papilio machaon TaxID=76193 RepID=A0A194QMW9_PAPMA|nr:hypothetical protein RR48_14054 [Papilio machaon]